MRLARHIVYPALFAVTACGSASDEPRFRSYDLKLTHPSPYSTYMSVSPGARGADLPRLRHIGSRGFSEYMRDSTGCVVDTSRPASVMGHKRMPAGYMVPIMCP